MRIGGYYIRTYTNSKDKFIYKVISYKEGIYTAMVVHNDLISDKSTLNQRVPYIIKIFKNETKDRRINKMEAYLEIL